MSNLISRLPLLTFFSFALLAITACSDPASPSSTPGVSAGPGTQSTPQLSVVAIGRDLSVDSTRLPLALLLQQDGETVRVEDAADRIHVSYGEMNSGEFTDANQFTWYEWPVQGGAYVMTPQFSTAGTWEIRAELEQDGTRHTASAFINVGGQSSSVAVGEPAPRTDSKTGATADELRQITSASEPNPAFYSMTVAEAVQSGKPTLITFSTPAFCQTATCGPQLDVVSDLRSRYGDQLNFLHVEVWDNPREMLDTGDSNIGRIAPAVNEWGLVTEPWTFLVDSQGLVFEKFEAFTTNSELTAAVDRMLAAG